MAKGRVYIVRNPLFPTLFKIGFTTKSSTKERGLSASNIPEAFEIIREYECDDCEELEKDRSKKCTVLCPSEYVGANKVLYNGEKYSLSGLALQLIR